MTKPAADRYGVIGYPVAHSRSPVIHQLFAEQTGQALSYERLEVPPQELANAIRSFQLNGGKGLNITLPHKSEAAKLVDECSEAADIAGAINTIVINEDGLYGDNTDGVGLLTDLTNNLGLELQDANVLILGAGGATRGIVHPLLSAGLNSLTIANRTLSRAEGLVAHFGRFGLAKACRFENVPKRAFDLIINATSAGLEGESPPYPEAAVSAQTACYDLSYGYTPTPFCRWAKESGAERIFMGWGMLIEQAAESFYRWRQVRPDTKPVLKQLSVNAS